MTRTDSYRETLNQLSPRGNLELAHVVAQAGNKKLFRQLLAFEGEENTPEVFLVFRGIMGLGKLAATEPMLFGQLREYASDPRWRIREAVATGLQLSGDQNMDLLLEEMQTWSKGNWHEKRAAAAGLAEPRLLKGAKYAKKALQILDRITRSMESSPDPKEDSFKILRQAMGYCWSVAIAALPEAGKPMLENGWTAKIKTLAG
jgi:hypothetical protein